VQLCRCPPGQLPPFQSMRATDGSRRQGRKYGRWVFVFLSPWDAAASCSTGLMGYIFATFNKLTCCIIIHVYIYLCLSQKSWVFVFHRRWNTGAYSWRRPWSGDIAVGSKRRRRGTGSLLLGWSVVVWVPPSSTVGSPKCALI
jgi:hypothetical protein